jgi:hypothetical protein
MAARTVRLLCAIGAAAAVPLGAQEPVVSRTLDSSAVVRFYLRSGGVEKGKLLTPFGPDSTMFRFCRYPAPPCTIGGDRYVERPEWDVTRLDLRSGTRLWWGTGIGASLGIIAGLTMIDFIEWGEERQLGTGEGIRVVLVSTAILVGIGALIGAGLDVWRPAP